MKSLHLAVTATALLLHNVCWTVAFAPHLRLATRPRLGVKGETSLEDDLLVEQDDRDTLQQSSFVEQMLQEKQAIDELMAAASRKGNMYESSLSDEDVQYYQEHHPPPSPSQQQKKGVNQHIDDTLNQSAFLGTMARDAKALADLMKTRPPSKKQAAAAAAVSPTVGTPTDDMYTRAAHRLQRLAEASRDKRAAAKELDAAREKARRSKKGPGAPFYSFNGPLTALSVLATGIGLGMVMNAPEDVAAIWNLNGMGTLDWSELDLPSNWLDLTRLHLPAGLTGSSSELLEQVSRQAADFQEHVLATTLPVVQEALLQRVADLREALPTAQDLEAVQKHMWELAQNADQQVMQKLRDVHLSLPAVQMDNIVAQVRDGWSGSSITTTGTIAIPSPDELMLKFNEAKDWMATQTSAAAGNIDMSNIFSSVESATLTFITQLRNTQESMASQASSWSVPDMSALLTQADQVKENAVTQAGNLQTEWSVIQDKLSAKSGEFMESSLPMYKEALVSQMNKAAGAVQSMASNIDTEDATEAFSAQINALQASLSQVQDSLAIQSGASIDALPVNEEVLASRITEATGTVQMPDLSNMNAQAFNEAIMGQVGAMAPVPTNIDPPQINAAVQSLMENMATQTTSSTKTVDVFELMGSDDLKVILKSVAY